MTSPETLAAILLWLAALLAVAHAGALIAPPGSAVVR